MLTLSLRSLPAQAVRGIYGPSKDQMPERMRYLHPDAAASYLEMADFAVVSDMFRSPESSLQAVREKRGAQPPSYSAHNYGLAIDLDIDAAKKRWNHGSKQALDAEMESRGWFCHRRDHTMEFEAWHFNFLGIGAPIPAGIHSTAGLVEARIVSLYGAGFAPDDTESQRLLAGLRLYAGEIDGDIGPLSRESIRAFQRTWGMPDTGELETRTRRTLAYVTCTRSLV
ncbi:MAG TPA: peptidoglycan-binding protein [Kofleriaceae bacterium]|nr:peptidoglycan-binding protein [Kofleriaceae bacterium]